MNLAGWKLCLQVARIQARVAALMALVVWPVSGGHAAASTLLGGLVPVCATLFMGITMFIVSRQTPKHVLAGFFLGEAGRLALAGVLLWLIFDLTTAFPEYVLVAFIIVLVAQSAASIRKIGNES